MQLPSSMPDLSTALDASQREAASNARFKQQVFGSIGGGMLFALVGVVTTMLAAGSVAPLVGIGVMAAAGLGCVYLAAKYLSKAVAIDQDAQARKIAIATKGRGLDTGLAPMPEMNKPVAGPPMGVDREEEVKPELVVKNQVPIISMDRALDPSQMMMAGGSTRIAAIEKPRTTVSQVAAHERLQDAPQQQIGA